jgi:hypothetical protein
VIFFKHTRSTKERPVLLILDDHDSHLSLDGIELCRESGIIILSLPPHCSHKLQPLDRSVYGPFKKYVNSMSDAWIRSNPGKTMSIYDIPEVVRDALPLATTFKNIQSGFRVSGVWPLNRHIFTDDEFLTSAVTDRPYLINADNEEKKGTATKKKGMVTKKGTVTKNGTMTQNDTERNTDRKRNNDESIVDEHQTPPHSHLAQELHIEIQQKFLEKWSVTAFTLLLKKD